MFRLSRKWILCCLLSANFLQSGAQVVLTAPPLTGIVRLDMLWNLLVVNQERLPFEGRLQVTLIDQHGQTVYSAHSSASTFTQGTKTFVYNAALPINHLYNSFSSYNDWIKAGKYNLCYALSKETAKGPAVVAEDCNELLIEPLSPPVLNEPYDNNSIYEVYPTFSWAPPMPVNIFKNLRYEFRLVRMEKGQSSVDAVELNNPVLVDQNVKEISKIFPSTYAALEIGREYAWQVTATDENFSGKSEIFRFKVVRDSIYNIIEASPFVALKQDRAELGVMHQGYIKINFTNYTNDNLATFEVFEEGNTNEALGSFTAPIKGGENFVLKQMKLKKKLDEKKIYQIVWVNSWKERWVVRYQPRYYK